MRMSSLRIEFTLKLVIAWYVCVSCKMSSPADMYHFLSIMVGPKFLSAGLITISSFVLRFQRTALTAALSSELSLCIVSLRLRVILMILSLHLAKYDFVSYVGWSGGSCICVSSTPYLSLCLALSLRLSMSTGSLLKLRSCCLGFSRSSRQSENSSNACKISMLETSLDSGM